MVDTAVDMGVMGATGMVVVFMEAGAVGAVGAGPTAMAGAAGAGLMVTAMTGACRTMA
jgi:hypothetical protein